MVILLKKCRTSKGCTIRDLAEKSGISKSYISEIERGEKIPTLDIICKLAKALECKPEELFRC